MDHSQQLKSELYRQALLHTVLSKIPWGLQKEEEPAEERE